jgi:hypothetical protein
MDEDNTNADAGAGNGSQQICRVVSDYESAYPDPLVISAGEELTIGAKGSSWSGWIWCTTRDGRSRWVPENYIKRKGDTGRALCDYEATELSVRVGEELIMGQEESGWIWCTNQEGRSGWVPADCVQGLQEDRGSRA